MTARDRTAIRAIVKALRGGKDSYRDMDALALSFEMPIAYPYFDSPQKRAVAFLLALTAKKKRKGKNGLDTHQAKP